MSNTTDNKDVESYSTVVFRSAAESVNVFQVGKLVYLARVPTTPDFEARVKEAARLQAANLNVKGCRACIQRAAAYAPLVGPDGPVFLSHMQACEDEPTVAVRALAVEAATKHSKRLVTPFVVTDSSFADKLQGGFPHWTVKPAHVTDAAAARLFERACYYDYVDMEGETMLTSLVATLLSGDEMVASMKLFDDCLKKTSRGAGLYRGTTDWMLGVQKYGLDNFGGRFWAHLSPLEKLHAVMYALGTSNLAKGDKEASACPNYHQANNSVLGFLKNAYDLDSMVALVNAQSAPENYQRRTAELSVGQLNVGAAKLGDFTNTVALVSELGVRYPGQYVTWPKSSVSDDAKTSSATGFEALRSSLESKKAVSGLSDKARLASGFAARAGVKAPQVALTTVSALLAVLTDGKPHTLTVNASTHSPWLLAHTTLAPEKLRSCQKHLWAVWNHLQASSWGASSETKVSSVFRMPMGELMFLCEGLKLPSHLGNFNFPEFLSPDMHSAKAAFEALNRTTVLSVPRLPDGDYFAAGVCASPQTSQRVLHKALTLTLDGVSHTLTRFE